MTTELNKNQHVSLITGVDLDAVKYKFDGYTSADIEKLLVATYGRENVPSAGSIRCWFAVGGRLHEFYKAYAANEAKFRRREAIDILRAHLGDASRTLVQIMGKSKSDMVKFLAAKELINRQLGEPIKPVANLTGKDPAQRILEELGIFEESEVENKKEEQKVEDSVKVETDK